MYLSIIVLVLILDDIVGYCRYEELFSSFFVPSSQWFTCPFYASLSVIPINSFVQLLFAFNYTSSAMVL